MPEAYASYDDDYERAAPRPRSRKPAKKAARKSRLFGLVRRNPGRAAGICLVLGLAGGIVANATLMQSARHPAPLFAGGPRAPAPAAPVGPDATIAPAAELAAPASAQRHPTDIASLLQATQPVTAPVAAPKTARVRPPADAGAAHRDAIATLLKTSAPAVPADRPSRVAAAQRALQKVGFVVRPDGEMNAVTRQAIERFERDRGLTVTGALSPRTVRELSAQSGVAIQ